MMMNTVKNSVRKLANEECRCLRVQWALETAELEQTLEENEEGAEGKKTSAKSAIIDALSKSYNGESNKSNSSKSSFLNFDVDRSAVFKARKS